VQFKGAEIFRKGQIKKQPGFQAAFKNIVEASFPLKRAGDDFYINCLTLPLRGAGGVFYPLSFQY